MRKHTIVGDISIPEGVLSLSETYVKSQHQRMKTKEKQASKGKTMLTGKKGKRSSKPKPSPAKERTQTQTPSKDRVSVDEKDPIQPPQTPFSYAGTSYHCSTKDDDGGIGLFSAPRQEPYRYRIKLKGK